MEINFAWLKDKIPGIMIGTEKFLLDTPDFWNLELNPVNFFSGFW